MRYRPLPLLISLARKWACVVVFLLCGAAASGQSLRIFQTAANMTDGMQSLAATAFGASGAGGGQVSLVVDEHSRYQKIRNLSASPHCHSRTSLAHAATGMASSCAVPGEHSLAQEAVAFLISPLRAGARTVSFWSQERDSDLDPGTCGPCQNLLTIDEATSSSTAHYGYAFILHASQFVLPGAYRIQSDSSDASALPNVAFRNPDGTIVLITVNDSALPLAFDLSWSQRVVTLRQSPGAITTFVWDPHEPPVSLHAIPADFSVTPPESATARLYLNALPHTAPRATLSCDAPAQLHCEVSPDRIAFTGEEIATASVTVHTVPPLEAHSRRSLQGAAALTLLACCWGFPFLFRNTRRHRLLSIVGCSLLMFVPACGDGPRVAVAGTTTPAGDYEVIVRVTPEAGASSSTSLSIHVQSSLHH